MPACPVAFGPSTKNKLGKLGAAIERYESGNPGNPPGRHALCRSIPLAIMGKAVENEMSAPVLQIIASTSL